MSNAAAAKVVRKQYEVNWKIDAGTVTEADFKAILADLDSYEAGYRKYTANKDFRIAPDELKANEITAEEAIEKMKKVLFGKK